MRALVAFILLGVCVSALALESTQRHPSSQSYSLKRGAHRRVTQRVQGGTVNFGGGIVRIGEYYATILVGGQPVNVQVDTGSSSLAIPEALCSNCVAASHPRYSSSLSSTFSPCNAGGCTFSLRYGDGSGVDGTLASDVITIGNVSARAELGLIKREINSFGNYDVPGILGVGFANINFDRRFPTVLDQISRTTGMPNLFGMCLTLDGGAWDVGFVNMARSQGPLQYVPVNPDRGYYSVTLKSVSVGTSVSGDLSNVAAIVDSGTTLFVVPQFWMNSFTNTLHSLNLPGLPQLFGSDGCASISAAEVSTFPTITIRLDAGNGGSLDLSLPPSSYLVPLEGQYCLGIAAMDDNMFILGDVVMENYYVVFDHDAPRVGFGPVNSQNCPSTVAASSGAAPSGAHFLKISQGTSSWGLLVAGAAGVFVMLSCIAIVAWCLRRPSSSVAYKPVEVPSQLSVSEAEALNQMPVAQV